MAYSGPSGVITAPAQSINSEGASPTTPGTEKSKKTPGSVRKYGLDLLYPGSETVTSTNPKFDIIAIHGLDAQSPETWIAWKDPQDPKSGDVHWLRDREMLPKSRPDSRILTYDWNANYDQYASTENFLNHADTLLDDIYSNRDRTDRLERPLIFIASCFGGLLLLQALVRAADNFPKSQSKYRRQVLDYTVGVAFLGTPFRGSWQTGTAALLARIEEAKRKGDDLTLEFGQYLKLGTREVPSPLGPLVQRFSEMVSEDEFKFDMVCVFETRDTSFEPIAKRAPTLGLDQAGHAIVVDQSSACLDGQDRLGMDSRHNMLHKYNSNESQGFIRITSRLQRFVEGADSVIHKKTNARRKSNFQERGWMNRKCLQDSQVVDPAAMIRRIRAEIDTRLRDVYQWCDECLGA